VAIRGTRAPKQQAQERSAESEVFSGWKEVANYLGKGVRTVQRYEREMRLPIHRPNGKSTGAVITTKAELDAWITGSPVRLHSTPRRWPSEQTNRIGAEFLQIDSEIGLTFSALALGSRDEGKRNRTGHTARRAYDTIMRLRKNIELTDPERHKLDANLRRLNSELQRLGV
jgi:hypothetical protein